MPLIVHCPAGCEIRVPLSRAGSIVRCSECKTLMQLRALTVEEKTQSQPIEIFATLAAPTALNPERVRGATSEHPGSAADPGEVYSEPATVVERTGRESPDSGQSDAFELPVPQPARLRFVSGNRRRRKLSQARRRTTATVIADVLEMGLERPDGVVDFDRIELLDQGDEEPSDNEFQFLAQFFATCISILGLVLIVPSLLAWSGWSVLPMQPTGSRWIFILIFLGALHLVYAIFLFQVHDRAALWSVAIFLLIVGCIQAVFTAGTWLDDGAGLIGRFLQLPGGETATVTLWCFLHLCFAILLCYLCGRQAIYWKHKHLRAMQAR